MSATPSTPATSTSGKVSGIPIAQLVVFAICFQPFLYVLYKHGKRGFLGWFCIQSFCLVRIVGSIVQIVQEKNNIPPNVATYVLISIGLSPLTLACLSILHEARQARNPKLNNKLEWFLIIQYHTVLIAAMVLIIIGIVNILGKADLSEPNAIYDAASNSTLLKVGFALFVVCWGILMAWILRSLRSQFVEATTYADGTKLLYGVLVAMPLLSLRLIYGICSFFVDSESFSTSVAAKVILSVVPEVIAVLVLLYVGMATVNIWKVRTHSFNVEDQTGRLYEGAPGRAYKMQHSK